MGLGDNGTDPVFTIFIYALLALAISVLALLFCLPYILFLKNRKSNIKNNLLFTFTILNILLGMSLIFIATHNIHKAVAFHENGGYVVIWSAVTIDIASLVLHIRKKF